MKLQLIVSILTFLSMQVNAQSNDYVITASKDTLKCKISTSFFTETHSYKLDDKGKSIKMKPTEVREYYLAGDKDLYMALYRENKSKPEFFKVLEKGKLLLVEQVTTVTYGGRLGSSSNKEWFVAKGTDTVRELKHSAIMLTGKSRDNRKNNFEEMIADNSSVLEKYKANDKFSFKQLRNLVHIYNTGEPLKKD